MASNATCNHKFEVPDYDLPGDDRSDGRRWMLTEDVPGVEDGVWSCPHEATPEHDRCPFHLPLADRPAEFDETRALLDRITTAATTDDQQHAQRLLQFIDATFETLAFRGKTVGEATNHALNLAHAEIGESDWTDVRFAQPVRFSHATFTGALTARDALFERAIGMRNVTFKHKVNYRGAEFCAPATLKHTTFEQDARFWYTRFHAHANFRQVTLKRTAYFEASDFEDYARFSNAVFHGDTTFTLAEFEDDADFDGAVFRGDHTFERAQFGRITNFSDVTVTGPLDLSGTTLAELIFVPHGGDGKVRLVSLRDAKIGGGRLGQPTDGAVIYDVTDATLGDIQFTAPGGGPLVDHVRFARTRFDSFVFEDDDLQPAVANWRIHETRADAPIEDTTLDTETLCQTYLNAKNGADQTGNNTAASAFFYRELSYRRQRYGELIVDSSRSLWSRIHNATKWGRNLTLMVSTGYGERPDRVVYFSMGVIGAFALIYAQLLPAEQYAPVDYIVLSFQSFITFILGSPPDGTTRVVEVMSAVEGFVGAFFIALFVFTFTRRIHR